MDDFEFICENCNKNILSVEDGKIYKTEDGYWLCEECYEEIIKDFEIKESE